MNYNVVTYDSPEFLNLEPTDVNPFIKKCDIKVLYTGANRNGSVITKEVAAEMAKTLRGAQIVGYYAESKEDFQDHGNKIVITNNGIEFKKETVPYGFVSPDALVWFQTFEEVDKKGNKVLREYLMTNGYIWTKISGAEKIFEGRPQSMELEEESLKGTWTEGDNGRVKLFIINDAKFEALCVLGEDVEPCFEGASIMPETQFNNNFSFKNTLFSMLKDLKEILKENEGGQSVEKDVEKNVSVEEVVGENPATEFVKEEEKPSKDAVEKDVEDTDKESTEKDTKEANEEEEKKKVAQNACNDDEKKRKYALEELQANYDELQKSYNELSTNYEKMKKENEELVSFKLKVEEKEKDQLIESFYMLSDEDKKDVIDNKTNYSLEDIKAKLSIICVDKKVSFTKEKTQEKAVEENPIATFNLQEVADNTPAWVKAVKANRK